MRDGTSLEVMTVVSVMAAMTVVDRPGNARRLGRNDVVGVRRPRAGCSSETDGDDRGAGHRDHTEGHEPPTDSAS
jgi:hypothetical protein